MLRCLHNCIFFFPLTFAGGCDNAQSSDAGKVKIISDPDELQEIRGEYRKEYWVSVSEGVRRGKAEALVSIKRGLQSSDWSINREALLELQMGFEDAPIVVDEEIIRLVYGFLDDEWNSAYVYSLLPLVAPDTGYLELERRLATTEDEGVWGLSCDALGRTRANESSIILLSELLKREAGHPDEVGNLLHCLISLHQTASESQRRTIENLVMPYKDAAENPLGWMLRSFSDHPNASMLSLFQTHVANPEFSEHCLIGIAKLTGKTAQPLINSYLNDSTKASDALYAIPYAWKDDLPGMIAALLKAYPRVFDFQQSLLFKQLQELGGREWVMALAQALPENAPRKNFELQYDLNYGPIEPDHPLLKTQAEYIRRGLLKGPLPPESLEFARALNREYGTKYEEASFAHEIPQIILFDQETNSSINPYVGLIMGKFVPAAGGQLDGLEVFTDGDKEDPDSRVEKLWMIFKGKGYFIEVREISDWYDMEAVEAILEKVLEDAAIRERFVKFMSDDQLAGYFFGIPDQANEAIEFLELELKK